MNPLPGRGTLPQKGQCRQDQIVKAARALAAAHDENDRALGIQPKGEATGGVRRRAGGVRRKPGAHRGAGDRDLTGLQPGGGFRKSDEGFVHPPREKTVGAPGEGIGFVKKRFGAGILGGEDGGRASEAAHGQNGVGTALLEEAGGGAP